MRQQFIYQAHYVIILHFYGVATISSKAIVLVLYLTPHAYRMWHLSLRCLAIFLSWCGLRQEQSYVGACYYILASNLEKLIEDSTCTDIQHLTLILGRIRVVQEVDGFWLLMWRYLDIRLL